MSEFTSAIKHLFYTIHPKSYLLSHFYTILPKFLVTRIFPFTFDSGLNVGPNPKKA